VANAVLHRVAEVGGSISAEHGVGRAKVEWLPLVQGQGPLTADNGFASQADVLLKTRLAADLLKPTPMDRPEDIETNPVNGLVYVVLTNNSSRKPDQVDRANPRASNDHGHILEIAPKDGDHANADGTWSIFLLAGKPKDPKQGRSSTRKPATMAGSSIPTTSPSIPKGRMFVATDGANDFGLPDGIYGVDTDSPARRLPSCCSPARGAEATGPLLHAGREDAVRLGPASGRGCGEPRQGGSRWPDFAVGIPPRPGVIAISATMAAPSRISGNVVGGEQAVLPAHHSLTLTKFFSRLANSRCGLAAKSRFPS
jgi:secreted PhoX family phosphatase